MAAAWFMRSGPAAAGRVSQSSIQRIIWRITWRISRCGLSPRELLSEESFFAPIEGIIIEPIRACHAAL
jgi:hypothetical protein